MSGGGKAIVAILIGLYMLAGFFMAFGSLLSVAGFSFWWSVAPAIAVGVVAIWLFDRVAMS